MYGDALDLICQLEEQREMLRQIEVDGEEKKALTEEGEGKDRAVQQKESQILSFREEVQDKEEQKSDEIDRLKLAHSSEVEQLRLQVIPKSN